VNETAPVDPTTLVDLFLRLSEIKGPIGLIALLIFVAIRLYRLPQWQEALPPKARWDNLSTLAKYGIIAGLAASGSWLASVSQNLSWQQTVAAALTAILAAVVTNKATKTEPVRTVVQIVVPPVGRQE
jgi:hypothetical protein